MKLSPIDELIRVVQTLQRLQHEQDCLLERELVERGWLAYWKNKVEITPDLKTILDTVEEYPTHRIPGIDFESR